MLKEHKKSLQKLSREFAPVAERSVVARKYRSSYVFVTEMDEHKKDSVVFVTAHKRIVKSTGMTTQRASIKKIVQVHNVIPLPSVPKRSVLPSKSVIPVKSLPVQQKIIVDKVMTLSDVKQQQKEEQPNIIRIPRGGRESVPTLSIPTKKTEEIGSYTFDVPTKTVSVLDKQQKVFVSKNFVKQARTTVVSLGEKIQYQFSQTFSKKQKGNTVIVPFPIIVETKAVVSESIKTTKVVQSKPPVVPSKQKTSSSAVRLQSISNPLARFSWITIKEIGKFATVSAVSFTFVIVVMNFTAYYQVGTYWWQKWRGEVTMDTKNLTQLVENKQKTDLLQVGEMGIPFLPKAGSAVPAISLDVISPDNRIIIPKIGKNVPIVEVPNNNLVSENWKDLETDIQDGLKNGVVHYPGTAVPGQVGNFFVTGHSSFYFWDKSKYKEVFALLPELEVGDLITVYYNQKKYVYEITDKQVVKPTNVEVLKQTNDKRMTMMTCYPVGTDLNRMILVAKEIEE